MCPPYQKSGSRRLTFRKPLWLSWLKTFHIHCDGMLVSVNEVLKLLDDLVSNKSAGMDGLNGEC